MNAVRDRSRGQPLLTLGLLLGGWIGVRAAMWEPPFATHARPGLADAPRLLRKVAAHDAGAVVGRDAGFAPLKTATPAARGWASTPVATGPAAQLAAQSRPFSVPRTPPVAILGQPRIVVADMVEQQTPTRTSAVLPGSAREAVRRWRAEAWVLYRPGATGQSPFGAFPTYGGSQAGSVVRFALAPRLSSAPQAYLRATRSLRGPSDSEAALGMSARLIAGLPLRFMGEARIRESGGTTKVRPAVLAVTEVSTLDLPLRSRAEVYAQGGYVGGPQATPFFDGQVVVERVLGPAATGDLAAGAGVWAGGQRGASRLDLGPHASLRLGAGPASARLALDWRFRVAGRARPESGPALTFSAGF